MRRRLAALLAGAFVLACLAAVALALLGRDSEPPGPRLDSSTPANQQGLRFLGASQSSNGALLFGHAYEIGPVQRLLALLHGVRPSASFSFNFSGTLAPAVGVLVRLPIALPVTAYGAPPPGCTVSVLGSDGKPLDPLLQTLPMGGHTWLLVAVPASFPDSVRWLDLRISTATGAQARWRVTGLPRPAHAIASPPRAAEAASLGPCSVTGAAGIGQGAKPASMMQRQDIAFAVRLAAPPRLDETWQLAGPSVTVDTEWQFGPQQVSVQPAFSAVRTPSLTGAIAVARRSAIRAIRVTGSVDHYKATMERVVFRGVPVTGGGGSGWLALSQSRTARTPSGIPVTLPGRGAGMPGPGLAAGDYLSVPVEVPTAIVRRAASQRPDDPTGRSDRIEVDVAGVEVVPDTQAPPASPLDPPPAPRPMRTAGATERKKVAVLATRASMGTVRLNQAFPSGTVALVVVIAERRKVGTLPYSIALPVRGTQP